MSIISLVLLVLVAAICGSIGQALVGYSVGGCLVSALVGFVGALFGSWLSIQFGFPEPFLVKIGSETFPVFWSIIGSALLVAIVAMLNRRRIGSY